MVVMDFYFFKGKKNLPTGFYLPHFNPVFLYPLLHLSWGIWRGQWFWDIMTGEGGSWTILLLVLNGWLKSPREMEDHIQTYSQGAGMPSGAKKQGLGRHIWTNLLARVTFVFLAKLFEFGTYFPT